MGTELVHVGFGNYVSGAHMIGVASPGSAPIKRLIHEGRTKGLTLDMTSGRRTKAVIFMENGAGVLAASGSFDGGITFIEMAISPSLAAPAASFGTSRMIRASIPGAATSWCCSAAG